jgi:hypothetical protein
MGKWIAYCTVYMSPSTNTVNRIPCEDPRVLDTLPQTLTPNCLSIRHSPTTKRSASNTCAWIKFKPSPSLPPQTKFSEPWRGTEAALGEDETKRGPFSFVLRLMSRNAAANITLPTHLWSCLIKRDAREGLLQVSRFATMGVEDY